ncbi:unnamed protein product, partial [Owenia fusiformis]
RTFIINKMMGAYTVQALYVLFFGYFVGSSLACSCMRIHPQEAYCSADFAILGRVISHVDTDKDDINRGHIIFTVKVIADYKGLGWAGQTKKIYTAPNSALCGVYLQDSNNYILIGGFNKGDPFTGTFPGEGVPFIGLCGYNLEASRVPKAVMKGLEKLYKANCKCEICRFPDDCKPGNCYLPAFTDTSCYDNAVCRRACKDSEGNTMCTWNLPRQWWKCVAQSNRCSVPGCPMFENDQLIDKPKEE